MTKPDDMPQDVWDRAESALFDGSSNVQKIIGCIARTIMAERKKLHWRPSPTAPKDGSDILVAFEWELDGMGAPPVVGIAYWEDGAWLQTYAHAAVPGEVTHWMPLPPVPEAKP